MGTAGATASRSDGDLASTRRSEALTSFPLDHHSIQTGPHYHRLDHRGASLDDRPLKTLKRPRFHDVRLPDPICPVARGLCECMSSLYKTPPSCLNRPTARRQPCVSRVRPTAADTRLQCFGNPASLNPKVPRHRQSEDAYDKPSLVCPSCVTGSHFTVRWLVKIARAAIPRLS